MLTSSRKPKKHLISVMLRLCLIAGLVSLVVGLRLASADPITFAVTQSGANGQFGTLDLGTGTFTALGSVRLGGYNGIGTLADGTLVGVDGNNNYIAIDGTTGDITIIGGTGINVTTSASLLTGEQYASRFFLPINCFSNDLRRF